MKDRAWPKAVKKLTNDNMYLSIACAGYQVDHANPLCAGGTDTRDSMQWLAGGVQLEIAAHPVEPHMDKVSAEAACALRQEGCHTFFEAGDIPD